MPFTGEPFKALLTDIVTPRYVYSLMDHFKCNPTMDKEFLTLTIGSGNRRIALVTGFSVNDYRISNALVHAVLNKCAEHVYSIPTFSSSQLSKWTMEVMPMVNPWPFNSWDVIKGKNTFYTIDGDGIPVRYDALTLRSKYSIKLHSMIHETRPELIIMLISSDKWSITVPKPIGVDNYDIIESSPADFTGHFSYEGYPTVIISVSRDAEPHEIINMVNQLIREHEIKRQETKSLELIVKANGDINGISSILRIHGLSVSIDGDKLIIRAGDEGTRALLNALVDNNLIEYYFDVEITEVQLQ
ncbi:hypothetical protein [Vulcanisaeta souniana]|uniref:Uncharacterized protein n=1 Tax=Vulcanisaeta souniana JCM 11219 TaxID=1293586 RepID=A0A830EE02_9CREN|nr:hypothetical protein [Vulcanisaeta souniana]BDR92116.1 hypothetical protein Vsou_12090 [Vulcanisaeta souniana JCM 11219]GGI67782.1 hypothetical protein GCM10007112_00990 [Vulcanisaeta souniana JCM 11219]